IGVCHSNGQYTIAYEDNSTRIQGVLFADGTRSVLFFGHKGLGRYCYGQGTADPALDGQGDPTGSHYCYDPDDASKDDHAYRYTEFVWAYDVNDLLAVRNGTRNPWDALPYVGWSFSVFGDRSGGGEVGVAWDPATRLAYMV